jgi:hypothetical protein
MRSADACRMKGKVLASFRLAFPRFLSGILGTWCCVGPILLLNGSESASWELWAGLLLLLLCYVVVIVIWLRAKWDALTKLISETTLALCFMNCRLTIKRNDGCFHGSKRRNGDCVCLLWLLHRGTHETKASYGRATRAVHLGTPQLFAIGRASLVFPPPCPIHFLRSFLQEQVNAHHSQVSLRASKHLCRASVVPT